jgi:hypothetical protein
MVNKTAVDFLAYELMNLDIAYEMGLEKNEFHKLRQEIIKKAKEMEKMQIIKAYDLGSLSEMQYPDPKTVIENGKQYYNKTFKTE